MQASLDWLADSGAEFSPGVGRSGLAHLKHYTAQYCVWGEGEPLVLVPGLAGGFELLVIGNRVVVSTSPSRAGRDETTCKL